MGHLWKVLVVDDEPLVRYALKRQLQEHFPDFQVIGEASSGPECLSVFRNSRPDIIIMDIEIPDMNGLETSVLILQESPLVKIIVLTAYDQFGYAQKAFNCGILGYLLKPVELESLRTQLDRAAFQLRSHETLEREHREHRVLKPLAVIGMVGAFMHGSQDGLDAPAYASMLENRIHSGYFLVLKIVLQREWNQNPTSFQDVYSVLQELPGVFAGAWIGMYLPVFVRYDDDGKPGDRTRCWHQEAEFIAHETTIRLRTRLSLSCSVGVGSLAHDPKLFPTSFREAFDAVQSSGDSAVIRFSVSCEQGTSSPMDSRAAGLVICPEEIRTAVLHAIVSRQWPQAQIAACEFAAEVSRSPASDVDKRLLFTDMLLQIRRLPLMYGTSCLPLMDASLRELMADLDASVLESWFSSVMAEICRIFESTEDAEDLQIRMILRYIDLHDFNAVSLDQVAEHAGLSSQYLSRIFKEHLGVNFIDYIVQKRIEEACSLLKDNRLGVKEIAMRCGYSDLAWFAKVFKRETGMTPREYRSRLP